MYHAGHGQDQAMVPSISVSAPGPKDSALDFGLPPKADATTPKFTDIIRQKALEVAAAVTASNQTWQALNNIGLADYLHSDLRPTFVIDNASPFTADSRSLSPIYCNPALQRDHNLSDQIYGNLNKSEIGVAPGRQYQDFIKWVVGESKQTSAGASYLHKGFLWSATTINGGKWRVVNGTTYSDMSNGEDCPSATKSRRGGLSSIASRLTSKTRSSKSGETKMLPVTYVDYNRTRSNSPEALHRVLSGQAFTKVDHGLPDSPDLNFDWMKRDLEELTPHVRSLREADWASTPLGPMSGWSSQLKQATSMILADPNPALLLWGPDCIMFYNDHYVPIIDAYGPVMGQSVFTALKEYNDHTIPAVSYVRQTGQAMHQEDLPLFLLKDGRLQEGWYNLTFIPLLDANGKVEALYEQIVDKTVTEIMRRRLNAFMELAKSTSKANSMSDLWHLAVESLQKQERDVPFALLYSIRSNDDGSINEPSSCSATSTYGKYAMLQAAIGVASGHKSAPFCICMEESGSGFMPYFREALKTKEPVVISTSEPNFPKSMLDGLMWRGFGEPCETFVVCPITPTKSDSVLGFFCVGLNPRRPLDDGYSKFIQVITNILATGMASVMLLEEERSRRESIIQASADRQAELAEQLQVKQQRIDLQERRFQRVALKADIALFIVKPTGEYIYRNECWYDVFRDAKDATRIDQAWPAMVDMDDMTHCKAAWQKLSIDKEPISYELRLKRLLEVEDYEEGSGLALRPEERRVWVLCSAYPELAADGSIKEIVGIAMNISKQKLAERIQKQRARDAMEAKQALENFIDTTSHEMRNPLSAITQTADGLLTNALNIVKSYDSFSKVPPERQEHIRGVIEAAHTIIQCSNHQRRIVDDVLTMSKLDSGLLTIFPIDAQPSVEIRHALKIFEAEARDAKVELAFDVEESYKTLDVDWVLMDPTRLIQVFVNLLTNAIKFTRLEAARNIVISIAASESAPGQAHGARYFDMQTAVAGDPTDGADWGEGDPLFIVVTVKDTGRGLTPEEKELLFMRFSQASPKTHVTYGGSGLGLYISRRLAEMQGGAIGFDSKLGEGSTFSFYIKVRRSLTEHPKSRLPFDGGIDVRDLEQMEKSPELFRRISSSSDITRQVSRAIENTPSLGQRKKSGVPDVLHILIVEDNLVNQRVLAKQLRNHGCVVEVANHGVEALKHIESTIYYGASAEELQSDDNATPTIPSSDTSTSSTPASMSSFSFAENGVTPFPKVTLTTSASTSTPPAPKKALTVILMDWEMPVMDGLTCVRRIRELQSQGKINKHVPIIAVTANARQEQIDTAMKAGFDDLCTKPCRVPDLMSRMKALLEKLSDEEELKGMEAQSVDAHIGCDEGDVELTVNMRGRSATRDDVRSTDESNVIQSAAGAAKE